MNATGWGKQAAAAVLTGLLIALVPSEARATDAQTGWWPPFVPDVAIPAVPPAEPEPVVGTVETLVLETYEAAGISGFRKDWNRAIPLAADGAMTNRTDETVNFGAGPVADWDAPDRPGALACDAVHRSLLLRFPGAAEQIAAALAGGRTILKVELVLPYLGHEVFPPAAYMNPAGLSFLGQVWRNKTPRWHAVAWGLLRPWTADREIGPTYNASIRGAAYWAGFGAREVGLDRGGAAFGPTPLNADLPEGRMDITAALTEAAYGEDLGARLRRLSDCGFLIRKWEAYDASFWNGGYEWATGTGPRGLLLGAPRLLVHLGPGEAGPIPLPPPADLHALAQQPPTGEPTAVFPSEQEFAAWASEFGRHKPDDMDDATWQRLQQLWAQDGKPHNFPETYAAYGEWIDGLLSRAPRRWSGFDAAELGGLIGIRYREALPTPLVEHLRLYWWAWLMPDRETSQLVQGYIGQDAAAAYYASTRDWRGNFSVYRTYCRSMGTMNFNHWASAGTLFGGTLLESPRLLVEGEAGLRDYPLKLWTWSSGSTQESIDHYYLSHTLATQLPFAAYSPTVEQGLMGEAILAKTIGELCSTFHPRLKRFTSSSGRTGIAYALHIQDGISSIMHTVLPGGALTDLGRTTIGNGMPVIGQDFAPSLAATMALDAPWAPAWYGPMVEAKPVPYQMTAQSGGWWKRSFQGQHYGVASLDVATVETVPFIVQWRNQDTAVTSSEALGMLIGRFGVNRTELLDSLWHSSSIRNPNGIVGNQGGPLASIQHRNRLFVLSSPNQGLHFNGRTRPAEITSLQTTLGLVTLHDGWSLLLDGQPVTPPFTATAGQRIVIADGVSFVGIVPLAGTDLGRDIEVEVLADGVSTQMQGGGQLAEALRINAYNYRGTALPQAEWSSEAVDKAWGGFAILAGDTTEHADAAAFDAALAGGSLTSAWDDVNNRVSLSWTLDGDTLACTFAPLESNLLPARTINGDWLYLPPGLVRECDLSAMGWTGRLEKNGFVYQSEPGQMGYLLTDPVHGIAEAWRPFPEPGPLALGLPGGGLVGMFGRVGITRLTVFRNENRVRIDGAVPGPGLATIAAVSGLPAGTDIVLNGQSALTVAGEKNGEPVVFVSLDGEQLPPVEKLLSLRITAAPGNWNDPATWVDGDTLGVPQAGDSVMLNHAVRLSETTPELEAFTNNATLTFNGWNTRLRAATVTVNGTITHPNQTDVTGTPGVNSDWTPDHRVWIVCTNLTVNNGQSIDMNGKGYQGGQGTLPRIGRGPGGGGGYGDGGATSGGGGTHGGGGVLTGRGSIYGSLTAPEDPGSGGAGNNWGNGGNGGGAVRIEATGKVTLNGTITADGNGPGHNRAGGGSGGSVFIACNAIAGGGTLSANGAAINGENGEGGAGAGGRVALVYDTAAQAVQNALAKPALTIRARQGGRGQSYSDAHGEPGTLYLSDASFFPGAAVQGGVLHVDGVTALTVPSLAISAGMFGVAEGTSLTVQGNVTATGRGGLYLRNSAIAIGGNLSLTCSASEFGQSYIYAGASGSLSVAGNLTTDRVRIWYGELNPAIQSMTVGGDFILTNGAPLYVNCGATDATSPAYGARIAVGGEWRIASGSTVSLKSHSTTYSTPLFEVGSFMLEAGATVTGNGLGYSRGPASYSPGYGPGGGKGSHTPPSGGGGHGGAGGLGGSGYGIAYGDANIPVTAGSAGGNSAWGAQAGNGGSCFRLVAARDVRIDGTVTMNGEDSFHERNGAGSGGGIYIHCRAFAGAGTIRAKGGSVTLGAILAGGGGGGRIAVWSQNKDGWIGELSYPDSVAGGSGGAAGGTGTLVWGSFYPVTYDANDATSGDVPAAQTKTHDEVLTLATNSNNLSRIGFAFAGWNTAADGSGTSYAAGAGYATDAAVTLYAQWSATNPDLRDYEAWKLLHWPGGQAPDTVTKRGRQMALHDVFVADLDPFDPNSMLEITRLERQWTNEAWHLMIEFAPASTTRLYAVQAAPDLSGQWQVAIPDIEPEGPSVQVVVPMDAQQHFYRIRVLVPQ
jgi:hypothetical protein